MNQHTQIFGKREKIPGPVKKAGEALATLLFPRRCPVCDGIVPQFGAKICPDCLPRLRIIMPPRCFCCGRGLLDGEKEYCGDCGAGRHRFIRGRALYDYQAAAPGIYRFKYAGRREYGAFYGEEIAFYLGDFIREIRPDALIPIPLHPRRFRKRGYNQALILAREIGRHTGVPVRPEILRRVKNTAPLKKLNPQERQNNLKKAFKITANDVKLKTIILIDDIYTTGSTVDEAARELTAHGVEGIYFIALAGRAGL